MINEKLMPEEEKNWLTGEPMSDPKIFFIDNAGLCLLSPWFLRLLSMLDYLNEARKDQRYEVKNSCHILATIPHLSRRKGIPGNSIGVQSSACWVADAYPVAKTTGPGCRGKTDCRQLAVRSKSKLAGYEWNVGERIYTKLYRSYGPLGGTGRKMGTYRGRQDA